MKVGISGPAGAGKSSLLSRVKDNSWIKKYKFTAKHPPAVDHLNSEDIQDHELLSIQTFIFNDHLKNLMFDASNIIMDTTILDTMVELLKLSRRNLCPPIVFDSYINNVCASLPRYDVIFLLFPEQDDTLRAEYDDIMLLLAPYANKIITLDPLQAKRHADIMVIEIQDIYKRKVEANEKNSDQWVSMYGEDYFSGLPQVPPGT